MKLYLYGPHPLLLALLLACGHPLPSLHKYIGRIITTTTTTTTSSYPSSHSRVLQRALKEMDKCTMRCCMGLFLMLLLVLAAQEAEGRVCESQSHGFHGTCIRSHNCALVCRNEGFSGGQCRGLRGRCFCTKLC